MLACLAEVGFATFPMTHAKRRRIFFSFLVLWLSARQQALTVCLHQQTYVVLCWLHLHEMANALQDFSDLVAQKAAQQKRKAAQAKESGKAKKQKSDNFKF